MYLQYFPVISLYFFLLIIFRTETEQKPFRRDLLSGICRIFDKTAFNSLTA